MKARSLCIAISLAVASSLMGTAHAGFPGTNGLIAFASNRSIDPGDPETTDEEIFTIDANGNNLTQLTSNATGDYDPQWSPDGTKIAFDSDRTGTDEIYVMDANGANVTRLTANNGENTQPAWSPDGTRLVFSSNRNGQYDLYVMRATDADADQNGDNVHRITKRLGDSPRWSPNGKWIAFSRSVNGGTEVFKIRPRLEGRHNRAINLTRTAGTDNQPDWSPDSSKIAFRSNRDGDAEIFTMHADGTHVRQLTHDDLHFDFTPAWSPDGTKITWSRIGTPTDIAVMAKDGSNQSNVTNDANADYEPDWQRL